MDSGSTGSADSGEFRPLFGGNQGSFSDRPLFGVVDSRRVRIINFLIGLTVVFLVLVAVIVALAKHSSALWGINIFLSFCVLIICLGHICLVHWYRQGDLDSKFSYLIYYNSVAIIMLSICVFVYASKV